MFASPFAFALLICRLLFDVCNVWEQVVLMKQEKVAALLDNDAHIAMLSAYEMDTKPHGHGDVHTLLSSTGLAAKWAAEGRRYVLFFQVRCAITVLLVFLPSAASVTCVFLQATCPPTPCSSLGLFLCCWDWLELTGLG